MDARLSQRTRTRTLCITLGLALVTAAGCAGSDPTPPPAADAAHVAEEEVTTTTTPGPEQLTIEPSTAPPVVPTDLAPHDVPAAGPTTYELTDVQLEFEAGGIVADDDHVWSMPHLDAVAQRIDPDAAQITSSIPLPRYSTAEVAVDDAVVLAVGNGKDAEGRIVSTLLQKFDVTGAELARVTVPHELDTMLVAFGSLWANGFDGVLTRMDPATLAIVGTYEVFDEPFLMAATPADLWLIADGGQLVRVDASTMRATDETSLLDLVPPDLRDTHGQFQVAGIGAIGEVLSLCTGGAVTFVDPARRVAVGLVRAPAGTVFQCFQLPAGPRGTWMHLVTLENGRFPEVARGELDPPVRLVLAATDGSVLGTVDTDYVERMTTSGDDLWWSVLRHHRVVRARPTP